MPRFSDVKPKATRREEIKNRVESSTLHDNLPIWEGNEGVQCKVIELPLDYLLFRLANRRTYDAQNFAAATKYTFDLPDGTTSVEASEEIFDPINQGEQDSQDHQYELLVVEARKISGRVGDLNLMQILEQEGWKSVDRPVITPDGVLVNGNCRVATIEYLIQNNISISGIDSLNPIIQVKVTPTNPTDDQSIDELERALQHGARGRLDYDWIQTTSDMRRLLTLFAKTMRPPEAKKKVHDMYSHVSRYAKMTDMDNWLAARILLEQTLDKIGLGGQAYGLKVPEILFLSSAKLRLKGQKAGWWKREHNKKLIEILAVLIQISIDGTPHRELRYEIEEIKTMEDLDRFYKALVECGAITTSPPIGLTGSSIGSSAVSPKSPQRQRVSIRKLNSDDLEKSARAVRDTAADIKDSHDIKDLENKPRKKLEEIKNNLRYYSQALDKAASNAKVVDKDELKVLFSEIQETIVDELNKLSE